jgi:hypothetical protein
MFQLPFVGVRHVITFELVCTLTSAAVDQLVPTAKQYCSTQHKRQQEMSIVAHSVSDMLYIAVP